MRQFPVLFDIVFPAVFQTWLDALAVLSLDMYTFVGIHCAGKGLPFVLILVESLW